MTEQHLKIEWEAAQRLIVAHARADAQVHPSIPTWSALGNVVQCYRVMIKAESELLDQLYTESKRRLLPLSAYPWFSLQPLFVHPEFRDLVLQEVRKRGGTTAEEGWLSWSGMQ